MEAMLTNPSGRMTLGSSVVKIGSAQDNHVVINDLKVASYHAEIRPRGDGEYSHTITDLGSTTGTFVNERRLDYNGSSLLHPSDIIQIGDAVFTYEVTGAPLGGEADQSAPGGIGAINRPLREGPPQDLFPRQDPNPSPPHGWLQGPPPGYQATPAYSQRNESSPYAPYAPPPTGGLAPASPFNSPSPTANRAEIYLGPASLLEKENRRKLWLAGGLTALVILLVAFLFGSFHSPGRALDNFCSALQSGNYQAAYDQLSPGVQGTVTEASFANSFTGNGRITSCTHSSPNVSGNSAEATLITNVNPASTVWLIQDSSSNWRIDNLSGL